MAPVALKIKQNTLTFNQGIIEHLKLLWELNTVMKLTYGLLGVYWLNFSQVFPSFQDKTKDNKQNIL